MPPSGKEKAAIMLLSMSEENASKVLSLMPEDMIRAASHAMVEIGTVSPIDVNEVAHEFIGLAGSAGAVGGASSVKALLGNLYNEDKANLILTGHDASQKTVWDRLSALTLTVFVEFLHEEHPQVASIILSRIDHKYAASALEMLYKANDEFATDILLRMTRSATISPAAIESIERSLSERFANNQVKHSKSQYALLAAIFNNFDPSVEKKLLLALDEQESEAADKIRDLMFVFEDLTRLESSKIQTIIRVADKNILAMAMKDASQNLRDHILESLPERARKILLAIMDDLGKVRIKDTHIAQAKILEVVRGLVESGTISLPNKHDDNDMVE